MRFCRTLWDTVQYDDKSLQLLCVGFLCRLCASGEFCVTLCSVAIIYYTLLATFIIRSVLFLRTTRMNGIEVLIVANIKHKSL